MPREKKKAPSFCAPFLSKNGLSTKHPAQQVCSSHLSLHTTVRRLFSQLCWSRSRIRQYPWEFGQSTAIPGAAFLARTFPPRRARVSDGPSPTLVHESSL